VAVTSFGYFNADYQGMQIALNTNPMSGYFTDFQLFGRALSERELHDFTSCRVFLKGTKF
jgi:hypothetical protein